MKKTQLFQRFVVEARVLSFSTTMLEKYKQKQNRFNFGQLLASSGAEHLQVTDIEHSLEKNF